MFIWSKIAHLERESGELGASEIKVIMLGKIFSYSCCLPNSSIKDFYTGITQFQVLSVLFIEYGQNVKHTISHRQSYFGKNVWVNVVNVDKDQ